MLDLINFILLHINLLNSFNIRLIIYPFYVLWNSLNIEIFILQISLIYAIYRFFFQKNIFKLCFTLMLFIIIVCIYISFFQLDIFATFLFLGEFMIAIFFFCFFYFIDNKNQTHALVTSTKFLFSIIYFFLFVIFFIFFFYIDLYTLDQDSFLLFISLYKLQNMFIVNDLIILFLIFFNFYVILFYAIGLILLLTTLYLFQAFWSFIIFNVFVIGKKKHKTNWAKIFKKRPNKNFKKIIKFFKKTSK